MKHLRYFFLLWMLSSFSYVSSFEPLPSNYTVTFGNTDAKTKIVEYFSFTCPHCLSIYRKDFARIKEKYIDCGKVTWIFHPVPMDKLTVQAMDCLSKLSEKDKQIFLEAILDIIPEDESAVLYLEKAMELFESPITRLQEKNYLSKTKAFQDAFLFIKQEDKVSALPTVSINGKLYLQEVPDFAFIDKKLKEEEKDR